MFTWLKQLFCKHEFVDECRVKTCDGRSYKNYCPSYQHNKCCKWHDEAYNLLHGYCDFCYKKCIKCGKVIEV